MCVPNLLSVIEDIFLYIRVCTLNHTASDLLEQSRMLFNSSDNTFKRVKFIFKIFSSTTNAYLELNVIYLRYCLVFSCGVTFTA